MIITTLPSPEGFNHIIDGRQCSLYIIHTPGGKAACAITNYGARVVSLLVPDRSGQLTDVALGYPTLDQYRAQPEEYMGAIVGRCANRIAAGLFVLEGHTYVLPVNNGHNTLHGGPGGLHARVWEIVSEAAHAVTLRYISVDGEEGFPGTLSIEVTYEWTTADTLQISYQATTDKTTLVNLSNHTYFNLSGEGAATILDHELQMTAGGITPVDGTLIPTGAIIPTNGTPFDFARSCAIGHAIDTADVQLAFGKGYDHNFVLSSEQPTITLHAPLTGIRMQLTTDRPGMQVYSGNFLDGSRKGKSGKHYAHRSAIVLEPQGFPDAIHHPQFPSVVLKPGNTYRSVSQYNFSAS